MKEISRFSFCIFCLLIAAVTGPGFHASAQPYPPTNCVPAPSGLVSWWPAEGNGGDIIGRNNGTLVNGVAFAPGEVGQAFEFNGSNTFVQVPSSPSLQPTGPFTLEAWVNYYQLTGMNGGTIAMKGPDAEVPADWALSIGAQHKLRPHVNLDGNWYYFDCNTTLNPGTWYHVALVYDGVRLEGFVNGMLDGMINVSGTVRTSADPMKIGAYASRNSPLTTSFFAGRIDELSLYNRALTASEIQAIYQAGSVGKCPSPVPPSLNDGLLAYYPFNGNANDESGNGNAGTVNGATLAPDRFGISNSAYAFPGSPPSKITIDSTNLLLPSDFSVSAWVNFDGGNLNPRILSVGYNYTGYEIGTDGTGSSRQVNFNDATASGLYNCTSSNAIAAGVWHQVVAVRSTNFMFLYIDGQLQGKTAIPVPVIYAGGFGSLWLPTIGGAAQIGSGNDAFGGEIDDVRIYGRALSGVEVTNLYDLESVPPPATNCVSAPPGLVSWWPAEGTAVDSVDGNDGFISNSVTYADGEVGTGFQFNGGSIRIPASSNLDVGSKSGITVELWVNPAITGRPDLSMPLPFLSWNNAVGGPSTYLGMLSPNPWTLPPNLPAMTGQLEARLVDKQGVSHLIRSASGLIGARTWQHVALTYDKTSGTATLYFNGAAVTQTNLGSFAPDTHSDLYLASQRPVIPVGAYLGFRGMLDEVSLYDRALTAAEMRAIVAARGAGKCAEPPVITEQPSNQTVSPGQTAVLNVAAEGTPNLRYQWFFNSNSIAGATDFFLTLTNVQPAQAGIYFVVVSNNFGVAISSNAELRVNTPPVADASATAPLAISCNDTNAKVILNGSRSFDPDGDPLHYLWYANDATNVFATGVVAVVRLPLGTNSITLRVSDGLAVGEQTITVDVITAAQAVDRLMAAVTAGVAKAQPLMASLSAAYASIERGNCIAAINQLHAFQNKVLAQVARHDPILARRLIKSAQHIIDALDRCCDVEGRGHGKINASFGKPHGRLHLEFPAAPGQVYIIEASSDLVHWEKVGAAADLKNGTFEFDDTNAVQSPMRFYRVVAP